MRSSVLTGPCQVAKLGAGQLGDHRRQRPHLLTVKRLLQQAPLAQVLVAVDDEDRVGARERPHELPALAGGRDRRGQGEDLAHRVGSAEQHHRLLGPIGADRGRVAEAPVHALQESAGPAHPGQRLPQRGRAAVPAAVCEPLCALPRSYVL